VTEKNSDRPSLWPWLWGSLGMTILAMLYSPILMLGAGGCCSGGGDPTAKAILAPAAPLMQVFSDLGCGTMFSIMLGVGLTYGLPVLALGAVITGLRRRGRSRE
jgi:hypothetical protein